MGITYRSRSGVIIRRPAKVDGCQAGEVGNGKGFLNRRGLGKMNQDEEHTIPSSIGQYGFSHGTC